MTVWGSQKYSKNIFYSLDGKENITLPITNDYVSMGSHSVISGITNLPKLADGEHQIEISADYGYVGTLEMKSSKTVDFEIDTLPPTLTLLSPKNQNYTQTDIPLELATNESSVVIYYAIDGEANATATENCTLTGLSFGYHNLTAYPIDGAGNTGLPSTVYFYVEQPVKGFFLIIISLVPIIAVALLAVVALVIHRGRYSKADSNK